MPEGDNLFRAATALSKALQGSRVTGFRSDVPLVLRALEEKPLEGARIEAAWPAASTSSSSSTTAASSARTCA